MSVIDANGLLDMFIELKKQIDLLIQSAHKENDILHGLWENAYRYLNDQTGTTLIESYNRARGDFLKLEDKFDCALSIQSIQVPDKRATAEDKYKEIIYNLLHCCDIEIVKIIGVLKEIIQIKLTQVDTDRLNHLKDQLTGMELDSNYEKNIMKAIELAERGEFLASAMVTGRVIVYQTAQIKSPPEDVIEDNKKTKHPLEYLDLCIKYYTEQGIISKPRADIKSLLKYGKEARNLLSHDLSIERNIADCLAILSSCIPLLSLCKELPCRT